MFEPASMADSNSASVRERLNAESMAYLKNRYSSRNEVNLHKTVMQLVGDDTMFEDDRKIEAAYHVSWAMMFYLGERKQKAFARLLNHTASRPPFAQYKRADRINDFDMVR